MTTPAPAARRCRQCREEGHDIRNCPLFERLHQEALHEYEQWIHHCIVDYHVCNKWHYDETESQAPTDANLLQLFIENRENTLNPVETVLKKPITWIQNQPIEHLRVLGHYFGIPKTDPYKTLPKEEWVTLLHFILFLEAEQKGTRYYEVKEAVPYLSASIGSFPALESINQHIRSLPYLPDDMMFKPTLYFRTLDERYGRIRELRTKTALNLRVTQQDLNENFREEVQIRRRINELRMRKARVENDSRRIERNVAKYESEMIMFLKLPPEPPKIMFHHAALNLLDQNTCSICYEPTEKKDMAHLECNHEFCASCILLTISGKFKVHSLELDDCLCPFCRGKINKVYGDVHNMRFVLREICNTKKLPLDLTFVVGGTS